MKSITIVVSIERVTLRHTLYIIIFHDLHVQDGIMSPLSTHINATKKNDFIRMQRLGRKFVKMLL